MLKTFTSLRVDNLFGIDKRLTSTDGTINMTLQDFFKQPDIEGNKLFYNACQYNSKRVIFYAKNHQKLTVQRSYKNSSMTLFQGTSQSNLRISFLITKNLQFSLVQKQSYNK